MLEFRKDPIIGRWVIISTERGRRPDDFPVDMDVRAHTICPFCPGNEHLTPSALLTVKNKATNQWSMRVVPNKYPALQVEGDLHPRADGIYDKMNGIGAHEVVIETDRHDSMLADLPLESIKNVLHAYKSRILDLKKDQRFKYILIFKNKGAAAGASLSHSHSQLIAMPIVPKRVTEELTGAEAYYKSKERCIFCDILDQELENQDRLIEETPTFASIAPYAPRFPFETWIMPKTHQYRYEDLNDAGLIDLSRILSNTLKRINCALDNPPYNFLIHNAPLRNGEELSFHWHIEIMPIVTRVAGFEWGTGFHINHTRPEEAAAFLREVKFQRGT
jgi:UDPglucose--hexose-1-phosphate uridylyltransferase